MAWQLDREWWMKGSGYTGERMDRAQDELAVGVGPGLSKHFL